MVLQVHAPDPYRPRVRVLFHPDGSPLDVPQDRNLFDTDGPAAQSVVAPLDEVGVPVPRVPRGLHPHVVAAHTKENGASPFQLGYFLKEVLLCESVAAPPGSASTPPT